MDNAVLVLPENRLRYFAPVFVCVSLIGVITGAVVFSMTFSDCDVYAYIDSLRLLPTGFPESLIYYLRRDAIALSAVLLCSVSALGWLLIPLVFAYLGLGIGVGMCCLVDSLGIDGAIYAALSLFIPYIISLTAHMTASRDAFFVSYSLFLSVIGRKAYRYSICPLFVKLPLCAAIAVCGAAFYAWSRGQTYLILG